MAKKVVVRLLSCVLFAGCNGITVPSAPAMQEGVIVGRDRPTSANQDRPTIWVKDPIEEECGVIYIIARGTDLFSRYSRGGVEEIGLGSLTVGAAVRVRAGGVADSCPGQSIAEAVELIPSD